MPDESTATPRDFLAVERTFLAWIRTGLALMGLGFVLAILGVAMAVYLISVRPLAQNNASKSQETSMAIPESGILRTASNHSVDETVARLQSILQAKGVKLFTIVDHSGEAASAGLKM